MKLFRVARKLSKGTPKPRESESSLSLSKETSRAKNSGDVKSNVIVTSTYLTFVLRHFDVEDRYASVYFHIYL